jgi:transposase
MGSRKGRAAVTRLEIVETGRRRRWSDAAKLRIIEESLAGGRLVSATARRHGISRSLLSTWRKLHREGRLGGDAVADFAPVVVAPEPQGGVPVRTEADFPAGRMAVLLANGRRILVGPDVDAMALARVVAALERA